MKLQIGVTTGICPWCHKKHAVRKGPDNIYVMGKHQVDNIGWCRGEGLAPEQIFTGYE